MHISPLKNIPLFRIRTAVLVILTVLLWFGALQYRELFHPDEGRYAEIPREMVASGDWVTPRLNGLKYFEKPVLQYWITAAAFHFLAQDAWTARLWPALSGFLTLIVVYFTGKRLGGPRAGLAAATILASTFIFFLFSQVLTLDMGLTFFLTLALSSFLASQDTRCTPAQASRREVLTWAAMALAVLSKGLIGIVLPGLVLAFYIVIERDWRILRQISWIRGIVVFLVISLPWFVAVQLRNPDFFHFFFVREHFARYALNEHHRAGAWYYFLLVLLVGSLPWTFAFPGAILESWRAKVNDFSPIRTGRFLVLWVAVITAFFSVSSSKLPAYVLPVFPALALLLGCTMVAKKFEISSRILIGIGVTGALIAAGGALVPHFPRISSNATAILPCVPWIILGGLILAISALAGRLMANRRQRMVLLVIAYGSVLAFQTLVAGTQSIADQFSSKALVEAAQRKIGAFPALVPFYSVGMYDQTLPFELKRTVTLVAYQDEFSMGIAAEPELAIQTMGQFRDQWLAQSQAYAILTRARFAEAKNLGLPMMVLAENRKALIVARSPAPKLTIRASPFYES